jgi:hypothetical protein
VFLTQYNERERDFSTRIVGGFEFVQEGLYDWGILDLGQAEYDWGILDLGQAEFAEGVLRLHPLGSGKHGTCEGAPGGGPRPEVGGGLFLPLFLGVEQLPEGPGLGQFFQAHGLQVAEMGVPILSRHEVTLRSPALGGGDDEVDRRVGFG